MLYGIISDIHGNLEALDAVLAHLMPSGEPAASQAAQPVEAYICIGDLVGYGPDPNDCVRRVRSLPGLLCVAGNHDLASIGKIDINWFNWHARKAIQWTAENLEPEARQFLESLPETAATGDLTIVHGSLPDPMEYITAPSEALATFRMMQTPVCLIGHTHVAEYHALSSGGVEHRYMTSGGELKIEAGFKYIVNCGGVGQPRDGNWMASFGTYDSDRKLIQIRRVAYDVAAVQSKMRAAGLPALLIERLAWGR
jgi:diadenosine tetraphosphatase ApaH/serine/threonine PP2A family protein phosphatase